MEHFKKHAIEEITQWAERYRVLLSFSEVGKEFSISKSTVNKCLKRYNHIFNLTFKDELDRKEQEEAAYLFLGGQKKCGTCRQTKGIAEFHKSNRTRDGLERECAECYNKQHHEYICQHIDAVRVSCRKAQSKINAEKKKEREGTYKCIDCHQRLPVNQFNDCYYSDGKEKRCMVCSEKAHNPTSKVCYQCGQEKSMDHFCFVSTSKRYDSICRECAREKSLVVYHNDPERASERGKEYYIEHKEEIIEYNKEWKRKFNKTPRGKLYCAIRNGIKRIVGVSNNYDSKIKIKNDCDNGSNIYEGFLGCSLDEAARYIESLWDEEMTWENHGFYGWHIDHVIPIASVREIDDIEQIKKVCHYTNLQPLWAEDNLKKSDKMPEEMSNV